MGAVFVGIAAVIPATSEHTIGTATATVVIGAVGVEAIISALRNRESWLARIGPLP